VKLNIFIQAAVALISIILGTSALSAAATAEGAANWPRFRGPNGSGLSDAEIPAKWTDADINWKIELPGGGNSSPVVWGDRVFLTCANDKTGEHRVVCINANDGSIRWKRTYPSHGYQHHPFNSYASSTPALDAEHVYVCWSTPEEFTLLALDHDGKDLWSKDLGPFISQHGGGQSPIAFENLVVVGDDQEGPNSFLFALDHNTGDQVWKIARRPSNKFAPATPCVFQPKDGLAELIFASKQQGFTAVDPKNGHTIWEIPTLFDSRPVASPYVADGLIFGSCGDGPSGHGFVAVRPAPNGHSAELAYEFKKSVPYVPTSIVKNKMLFYVSDSGMMACIHADTGDKIWKERLDGTFFGSFVCAGDKLFITSKEGEVFVIAASDKFELLARNPVKFEADDPGIPPLSTTAAIAGGRMYVRTYTHLMSVGGKK
jgi:outer membrane protein assembly factor BamB